MQAPQNGSSTDSRFLDNQSSGLFVKAVLQLRGKCKVEQGWGVTPELLATDNEISGNTKKKNLFHVSVG